MWPNFLAYDIVASMNNSCKVNSPLVKCLFWADILPFRHTGVCYPFEECLSGLGEKVLISIFLE